MSYHVRLIEDDQLPSDQSWVMVRSEGDCIFFVKPAALTPRTLERAWYAYALLSCESVGVGR